MISGTLKKILLGQSTDRLSRDVLGRMVTLLQSLRARAQDTYPPVYVARLASAETTH